MGVAISLPDKKVWQLAPESELRFEVGPDRVFSLTLIR